MSLLKSLAIRRRDKQRKGGNYFNCRSKSRNSNTSKIINYPNKRESLKKCHRIIFNMHTKQYLSCKIQWRFINFSVCECQVHYNNKFNWKRTHRHTNKHKISRENEHIKKYERFFWKENKNRIERREEKEEKKNVKWKKKTVLNGVVYGL